METTNPYRVELFWKKVDKEGPEAKDGLGRCWIWTAAKDRSGYGNFTAAKGKTCKAHRFSFLLAFGWLLSHPYQVDHKCENTSCVNPKHLLLLPGWENNAKSNSASAINKRKTHCIRGHEFSEGNTIRYKGKRLCRECEQEKIDKWRSR